MAVDRVASAEVAEGASNSGALLLPEGLGFTKLTLIVDITAVAGTSPTLDLDLEWSMDGTLFAAPETADTFTTLTATGQVAKQFDVKGKYYRIMYVVGGTATPTVTFAIDEHVA